MLVKLRPFVSFMNSLFCIFSLVLNFSSAINLERIAAFKMLVHITNQFAQSKQTFEISLRILRKRFYTKQFY
jgi:hypothetical protein